eukprot:15465923-Alexandrium_andersonii.AAC.1
MNLSGDLTTDWRAVGDALPPALAGVMVMRGATVFANPQEAHAQAQWRMWTGLCGNFARPARGPMN